MVTLVPQRWILHADMDAFYASVEQRDHPQWRGKPVIVGASSARGVVSAASYEARAFGVYSAMPGFRARQLCPDGIFVAGDIEKYSRVSKAVHRVFAEFTDAIEPLALDEAFLDISGSVSLFGPPLEIGRRIKDAVLDQTRLVVSVGIAPNKLVAKIACGLSKPDGLLLITPDRISQVLAPLPIRKLWGVGPRTEQALLAAGLDTLGRVAEAPLALLRQVVGNRAEELAQRARGVDLREVVSSRAPKSIGEEATFAADVLDRELVSEALTAHAEAVARRARRAGFVGRTVNLKIKLGRARGHRAPRNDGPGEPSYPLLSRSRTLSSATADGALIRRVALELWDRCGVTEPVRLLGVSLSNLQAAPKVTADGARPPAAAPASTPHAAAPHAALTAQLDLFELRRPPPPAQHQAVQRWPSEAGLSPIRTDPGEQRVRGEALGRALDAIEDKFGRGAVRRAVHAPDKVTQTDRLKVGEEPDDS